MIEYLSALASASYGSTAVGPSGFTYTWVSNSSRSLYPSTWTAAVADVGSGLSDLATSIFWVTPERLQMTPFSLPVVTDLMSLYVPMPKEDKGLFSQMNKPFQPFTGGVWLTILLVIVAVGTLQLVLTKRLWWDEWAERVKWESASRGARSALLASRLVDSWYESYLTVLGGAPSYDEHHRLATRLLNAGLGLFLVVLLSAYTANLAAFLGQPSTEDYWHDIEEATAAGAKICAHVVLRSKLTQRYPSTNFHFRNMDVASDVRAGIAVDQCQAFIMATRDMDVGTTVDAVRCELGFVQAGNPVEEQTVAWPAAPEIATALSYWMAQAAASGVTYQSIQNKYETDPICPRFPAVGSSDGLSQLNLTNVGAPLLIMVIFMILAIATRTLRTAHVAARKSVKRWSTKRVQDMEMQVEENTMTASTNQATIAQNVGKIEQNSAVSLANKAKIGELEEEIEGASEERSQLRKDLQEVTAAQKELIQMLRTHAGMLGGAPAPSWEAGK